MPTQYINGIPIIWDEEEDKRLLGHLFADGKVPQPIFLQNNNRNLLMGSELEQTRRAVAAASPFGKNSIFYRNPAPKKEDFKADFYQNVANIPLLLSDIKNYIGDDNFLFNADNYKNAKTTTYLIVDMNGTRKEVFVNVSLNSMEHHLDKIFFSMFYEVSKIHFKLYVSYMDTAEYIKDAIDTPDPNDVLLDLQYIAIILKINNIDDFIAVTKACDPLGSGRYKNNLLEGYNKLFKLASTNQKMLKHLYEQAPLFAIKARKDTDKIADIEKLLKYDKGSDWIVDGWFKDSSNAMIKLLSGFNDLDLLYAFFNDNPEKLLEIYSFLSSMGKKLLCEILSMLHQYIIIKYPNAAIVVFDNFTIGKGYKNTAKVVNNDIVFEKWENTPILYEVATQTNGDAILGIVGYEQKLLETTTLNPFYLVTLHDEDTGNTIRCTALYVKYLADVERKEEITELVLVSLALVSILLSAGALAAPSVALTSFTGVMATADIILNTTFLALMDDDVKAWLNKSEAGSWFVEHWDTIYLASGGLLFSAAIAKGILQHGPALLTYLDTATNSAIASTRNFVMSAMLTALLELKIANFVPRSLKYYPTAVKAILASRSQLNAVAVSRLYKAQAYIVEGRVMVREMEQQGFALLYNGEVIASGTTKEVNDIIKNITANGNEVAKALEGISAFWKELNSFAENGAAKFWKHLDGEVIMTENGLFKKGIGGHNYQKTKNGEMKVIGEKIPMYPINDQPFIAKVQFRDPHIPKNWINKSNSSLRINGKQVRMATTFFPINWSEVRIQFEISFAFGNKVSISKTIDDIGTFTEIFRGKVTVGFETEFVYKNGILKSAIPIVKNIR